MPSAKIALEDIRASLLFHDDFPKWEGAFAGEAPSESLISQRKIASAKAIELARQDWRPLENLITLLGQDRYEPAVPVLAELWRTCALLPVRVATGHALFFIGSDAALDVLEETLIDPDRFSQHMAIKTILAREPKTAFDRLSPVLETSAHPDMTGEILHLLLDATSLPGWPNGQAAPIDQDGRWLLECAKRRNHLDYGHLAREVLQNAPLSLVETTLAEVRALEERAGLRAPARVERDGTLLRRYRSGEFVAVWNDIRHAGDIAGSFHGEVLDVADATMERVAENADMISDILRSHGWRALGADYSDLRTPPTQSGRETMDRIERETGEPLPPALKAFWRTVGGINWVWDYQCAETRPDFGLDLPLDELDPLCIDPAEVVSYCLDEWVDQKEDRIEALAGPLVLELAPDVYHKANISGGQSYSIILPTRVADPIFAFEPHGLPFVDYLRLAFSWCGFPGLEAHAGQAGVEALLDQLGRKSLVPF